VNILRRLLRSRKGTNRNAPGKSLLTVEPLEARVLLDAEYSVIDLGTLGGNFSAAMGINESGDVAGYAYDAQSDIWAFYYDSDTQIMTARPNAAGISGFGAEYSYGFDINDAGIIVGQLDHWMGNDIAFYDSGSNAYSIHLKTTDWSSSAKAINNVSPYPTIVGYYYDTDADPDNITPYAFKHNIGTGWTDLDSDPSAANDINNTNQIIGKSLVTTSYGSYYHATMWYNGTETDLDAGNNYGSEAVGINNLGQVVGWKHTGLGSQFHAFSWTAAGGLQELTTLEGGDYNSDARAVNDQGQIVGTSDTWVGSEKTYRAFIYENGVMENLESLVANLGSWKLLAAEDINEKGQIVGWGYLNNDVHGFLLDPIGDTTAPTAALTASDITTVGGTNHVFTVNYQDDTVIDVSSLDNSDIRVTGPNGFNQLAVLVSVDNNTDGAPRIATYRIDAPGGSWDPADNGVYAVSIAADQVSDTANNYVAAGQLGSFTAALVLPPSADLAYPANGQSLPIVQINTNQRYLEVKFIDRSGLGLKAQTITDAEAEFSLGGLAASNVTVNGASTLASGTTSTYRYTFSGDFSAGAVTVNFTACAWSDNANTLNTAETESFMVVLTDTVGSRIIKLEPDKPTRPGIDKVEVTFSEAILASSFTKEDITITDAQGGGVSVNSVEKLANDKYRITFAAQDQAGDYTVKIGPDVKDLYGNKMDQDSDQIKGETPDDIYQGKFTIAPSELMIFEHDPDGSVKGMVDHIDVTFSVEIDPTSFTADDIKLAGPAGNITINGIHLENQEENIYRIMIDPQDQAGGYSLLIGPEIETPDGELMNQDLDEQAGEPTEDIYQGSFIIEVSGLYVTGHAPSGRQKPGVDHVDITFSEDINPISFDADDVSITGPSGSIDIDEVIHNTGNTYRVKFSVQNTDGSYTVEVGPDIYGPLDNYMNQDKDAKPGEKPDDAYVSNFIIGTLDLNYVMVDLGTLGGDYSEANGVNDFGQVVGSSEDAAGNTQAFIWEDGIMTALPNLGGTYNCAYAINNSGAILGSSRDSSGSDYVVIWSASGGIQNLGKAWATDGDINNSGDIVLGERFGTQLTYFYNVIPSAMDTYHQINGKGISDGGMMVGYAVPPNMASSWGAVTINGTSVQGLAYLPGGSESAALGVSPSGAVITGWSYTAASGAHACVWMAGAVKDINKFTDKSYGQAANDLGCVVGYYTVGSQYVSPTAAFIYDGAQTKTLWETPYYRQNAGWDSWYSFEEANDINVTTEVVGSGKVYTADGLKNHGFYMRHPLQARPTVTLDNPAYGAMAPRLELNQRGYIDVTFFDDGKVGLDKPTIEDSTPEFKLEGVAATYVTIGDKPTLVKEDAQGITYRYSFMGSFNHGIVDVEFIDGAWYDKAGMPGVGKYESFNVGLDPDEYDKKGPDNTAAQASTISTDGTIQLHNIHQIGDVDWAKFYVAVNSSMIIEADSQSGMTEMWLYGPDDPTKLLEHNVQGAENGLSARIVRSGANQLSPGTYYVRVEELFDRYTIDLYDLTVTKIDVQADVREIHGWNGYGTNPVKFGRYIGGVKMVDKNPDDGDFTFEVTLSGDDADEVDKVEFKLGTTISYTDSDGSDGWTWPGVPIHWLNKNTELKINTIDDDAKLKVEAFWGTVEVTPFPDWLTMDDEFTFWNPDTKTYHLAGYYQPESWDMAFEISQSGLLSGINGFSPGLAVVINAGLKVEDSAISSQADVYMDAQIKGFNIWSHKDKRPLYLGQNLPFTVDARTLKPKSFHYEVEITDLAKVNINLGNPSAKYVLTRWYPFVGTPLPIFFPFKDGVDWTRNRLTYGEGDIDWTQCDIYTVINPVSIPLPPDPTGIFSGASVDFTLGMILDVGFKLHINWDDARQDWDIQDNHGQFKVGCRLSGAVAPGVDILWGGLMCRLKGGPEGTLDLMSNFTRIAGKDVGIPDIAGKYRFIIELIGSILWLDKETFGIEDRLKTVIPNNPPTATIGSEDYYYWADIITWVEQSVFAPLPAVSTKSLIALAAGSAPEPSEPVYSRSPQIVSRGDGTLYKIYIEDADAGALFQPELFLQKKTPDQDWTTPLQLTSDGLPKGTPSLGFVADGDPLIAWTAQTSRQGPTQIENMMSYEIYWARLDEQNPQAPITPVRLTDNDTIDGGVSIGVDQEGLLTWGQFNASSTLWNVRYALWDETGGFVIQPELVSDPAKYAAGFKSVQGPKDKGMTVWLSGSLNADKVLTDLKPMYRIFSNGTLNQAQPVPFNNTQAQANSIDVAFGPDGKVYVVWSQKEEGVYSVWFNTYEPDTQTWGQTQQVMDESILQSPQICVTNNGKVNIIVAQWQQDNSQLLMTSFDTTDPQAAWSEPEIIAESSDALFDQTASFDPEGNLFLAWMAENTAVEYIVAAPTMIELQDRQSVKYYDGDGSLVTVQLAGTDGKVFFDGHNINVIQGKNGFEIQGSNLVLSEIRLVAATEKASITMNAKGGSDSQASLGGIKGDQLVKLNAKNIDLIGDINLTGSLGAIIVDDIADDVTITAAQPYEKGFALKADEIGSGVEFDLAGLVKSFQATSFTEGKLTADIIGQIKTKTGDFGVDISARTGDILSIDAVGDISGNINSAGTIKKIMTKLGDVTGTVRAGVELGMVQAINLDHAILSAGQTIKSVKLSGDIIDSYVLGGYDIGADCAFGLQETGGGDVLSSGDVTSVTVKGTFSRSYIVAGTLPDTSLTSYLPNVGQMASTGYIGKIKFGNINYDDADDYFGLFAATEIKPFKIGKSLAVSQGMFVIE